MDVFPGSNREIKLFSLVKGKGSSKLCRIRNDNDDDGNNGIIKKCVLVYLHKSKVSSLKYEGERGKMFLTSDFCMNR